MTRVFPSDILIVDDAPDNLELLAEILGEHGYQIRAVKDGPRALDAVQTTPPDLILLDVRMPGMDGYEVCRRLKTDAHTRDIPIIFVSALQDTEDKVKGFSVGGVDFVTRPFHPEEVLARVETHLALRSMQKRLQEQNLQLRREIAERMRVEEALQKAKEVGEQAAVAAERNRLARDLHDAVTQTLFSASLIAETVPRVWERYPEEGRRGLEELRQLTRGALAEMRTLLLELRPAALTEKNLGELLRNLTEAVTSRTRVPIALAVQGDGCLPPNVQVALYRIAQEALNNIAKHAGASRASVSLRCQSERVALRIWDDGCGFDPHAIPPGHLGVGIMRERARKISAEMQIESQPGCGAQVVVVWPE